MMDSKEKKINTTKAKSLCMPALPVITVARDGESL